MIDELTMTMLEDLREAIDSVLTHALPTLGARAEIVQSPQLGIFIRVSGQPSHYPSILLAEAVLKIDRESARRVLLDPK